MNLLAHAYLSFEDEELLIGNLIADMIRGKQIDEFPERVRLGVDMHRQIDTFTDQHPVVKEATLFLKPLAGRYSGSFLDIAYDYFLSNSKLYTPTEGWNAFAKECYTIIERNYKMLPQRFVSMYMYMRREDWFSNYGKKSLIKLSYERLQNRASFLTDDANIFSAFDSHEEELKLSFAAFFPDLVKFTEGLK